MLHIITYYCTVLVTNEVEKYGEAKI